MMRLVNHTGGIQVLCFSSTNEARRVGDHLAAMADGCTCYGTAPGTIDPAVLLSIMERTKADAGTPPMPFWLVFTKQGRMPKYIHRDRGKAVAEATRLAAENPGRAFWILESAECVLLPKGAE